MISRRERLKTIYKALTNRLLILTVALGALLYAAAAGAFHLQILHADDYEPGAQSAKQREKIVKTAAARGEIFDRNGVPLAVNEAVYVVKIDPSVRVDDVAAAFTDFTRVMNRYDEPLTDDLPISMTTPRAFLFDGSVKREAAWKRDMDLNADYTADECYDYLLSFFNIPENMPKAQRRQVLALCAARYMERYYLNPITVSVGVGQAAIAAIEENKPDFPNVYIDKDYLRHYPEGETLAHQLGYIRKISAEELDQYKELGYTSADIVGKEGVERAYEVNLRGRAGETRVLLDDQGRQTAREKISDALPGDNVFLTIDAKLQRFATETLEDQLRTILVNKLLGKSAKEKPVTAQNVLAGLVQTRAVDMEALLSAEEDTLSYPARAYIEALELDHGAEYANAARAALIEAVNDNKITTNQLVGALIDQEVVSATEAETELVRKGRLTTLTFLVKKIEEREITPAMAYQTPFSGTAVVVDVRSGDVLAAANYPNYDNNRFVNRFDSAYFTQLMNDPTKRMLNRAFGSPMPPGSTFKMITAVAGLESGVITPRTTIFDRVTFTSAGQPYAKCHGSHGNVDVAHALEQSCNYFFFETSYRLGNTKEGTKMEGIQTLNSYMAAFGLNDPTGVEIGELYTSRGLEYPNLSGPERKAVAEMNAADLRGEFATETQKRWEDGDTIRTAIGQAWNAYTAANMAKYIATLADGGTRFQMRLMRKLVHADGTAYENEPVVERKIDMQPENLKAVYNGMRLVTKSGTAAGVFRDFPMPVAGKTGTTQQSLTGTPDHASFACFAPYDEADPAGEALIAVYVVIPNGNTLTTLSPAAAAARDIVGWYFGVGKEEGSGEKQEEGGLPPTAEEAGADAAVYYELTE